MQSSYAITAIALLLGLSNRASSAEPPKIEVGRAQIAWQDLPGVDGQSHALADLADRDVVVVSITCNHCPIAIEYYGRMKEFVRRHCGSEGKAALVAISLSDLETDRLPRMKEMARRQGFNFPYLHDATQQVGKDLGATITPQFFVLDRNRTLVYRGAWDDNLNGTKVKARYVESAVMAVLDGKPVPVAETKAKGCLIDYGR